jgi:hypothetical protein
VTITVQPCCGALRRYERARPGELVHMDVKKIGKIPAGGGRRAHGRPATKAEKMRRPKIGYDYVHSLVDDHSRLAYSEILTDELGTTCAAFLLRAAAYFAGHGIPRIERLITDNAWAYRHSTAVKQAVAQLGAKHKFIKPHCPWQKARSSGSTARYRPKGPTGSSSSATPTVPPRLPPGWSSTTLDADTPHLAASRQPADCHQPCDRVQLGRGAWTLRGLSCPPRSTPARASPLIPVRRPQYSTRPRCRVSPLSFCKAGIDHIGVWTADLGATVIALAVADLLRAAGVTVAL